jgi:hypothetical protein
MTRQFELALAKRSVFPGLAGNLRLETGSQLTASTAISMGAFSNNLDCGRPMAGPNTFAGSQARGRRGLGSSAFNSWSTLALAVASPTKRR